VLAAIVESKLNNMAASDERIKRLRRINNVGPRLAETVVAFLDDPNPDAVAIDAVIVPEEILGLQAEGHRLTRLLLKFANSAKSGKA
jgi:hypothetical protein